MMLNTITIYSSLQMHKGSATFPMLGVAFDSLARAIAEGVATWILNPSNVAMEGISTGMVGSGTIQAQGSKLVLLPGIPLMTNGLSSAGIIGPLAPSLSTIVTLAICHAVTNFGGYSGVCSTVGVGTDVSKVVVANPGTLITDLKKSMLINKITGAASNQMATGLGLGISSLVGTITGSGKVVGLSGSNPSTGVSFSKVV